MTKKSKKVTPFFVTLLGFIALTLMIFNAVRFVTALIQWHLIVDFMSLPMPLYIASTGLLWALSWFLVYLGIELSEKWTPFAVLGVSFSYIAYYWIDRFLFQSAAGRDNTKFAVVMTFVFSLFIIIALALPKSRAYFDEIIERDERN
ncbi:MAG: hypothetical protein DRI32_04670 [Chloroflexi bacterium]|nr:MAG: hypothetical protein DRI32_04670 [Chloroflexota bacterium]